MADVDVAILGGGMAGLTAGLYAAWHRLDAVLLERMGTGGQIVNAATIENYPGFPTGVKGYELAAAAAEQALNMGLRMEYMNVQGLRSEAGRHVVVTDGEEVRARAVIIAVGSALAKLGVPGEDEFEGRGVSYCAVCDAEFFRDQAVVVVGGGDSALDEALFLAEVAASVQIVHRRDEFRAAAALQERVLAHAKISIAWNTTVTAIQGDEGVERVIAQGPDGADSPVPCTGVFIYTGLAPTTGFLRDLLPVDAAGHIPVDEWMRTPIPGILAAGDIRQHSARQLVTVAGDGATAAIAALRYLKTGEWSG